VILRVEGNINQGRSMPNYKLIVPVVAVALLGATIAIAEVVRDRHEHGDRSGEADSAGWHNEMCADRFAHDTAKIAYLETRLELTDAQRPAFENWKSSVLAAANSQKNNCAARTADAGHAPTILDREAREEVMLKARVAALDAELPSLTALYQTLSPDQRAMLDRPRHDHEGHHRHDGDSWGGHDSHEGGPAPKTE
jgi:hypothetical protein